MAKRQSAQMSLVIKPMIGFVLRTISLCVILLSSKRTINAMLPALPMELTKIIFCDIVTSDTPAELKTEYHVRRCKKARALLTLCKRFYASEQLQHALISSIIEEYGVFSPIFTCAYINTHQSKQWLFNWLLKDPKNREYAIKLWGRQYQKDTFNVREFGQQKQILRTLMATGISIDQQDDLYKKTLLMKTCKHGDTCMEEFLIAQGANQDILDRHGHTARYYKNLRSFNSRKAGAPASAISFFSIDTEIT